MAKRKIRVHLISMRGGLVRLMCKLKKKKKGKNGSVAKFFIPYAGAQGEEHWFTRRRLRLLVKRGQLAREAGDLLLSFPQFKAA